MLLTEISLVLLCAAIIGNQWHYTERRCDELLNSISSEPIYTHLCPYYNERRRVLCRSAELYSVIQIKTKFIDRQKIQKSISPEKISKNYLLKLMFHWVSLCPIGIRINSTSCPSVLLRNFRIKGRASY